MNVEELRLSIITHSKLEYSKSSGPGGQNVNKVNTKATLHIHLDTIEGLLPSELALVRARLANRISSEGELVVQVQEERSQTANRERALEKLIALIEHAAKVRAPRIPTKPTRASKERNLKKKHLRASTKNSRRNPVIDE
jgi:ribosome-associated protein